ncbi:hypothetical protein JCM19238_2580 [Vibrio ponticus]|nr:hypothetical protein JCM19238_2580 [Vibrio ponticus]
MRIALPGYRKIQALQEAPVALQTKLEHWHIRLIKSANSKWAMSACMR